MAFIKRCYKLLIEVESAKKVFKEDENTRGLKIEFEAINSCFSKSFCQGNITIYNLSDDDMYYLASSAQILPNKNNPVMKKNAVQLEVGYNNDLGIILAGNIIAVDSNFNGADRRVNLKVQSSVSNNLQNNKIQIAFENNVSNKQIAEQVAKENGLTLKWDSKIKELKQSAFSFLGSPLQLLSNFRQMFENELNVWIENDGKTLNVTPIDTPANSIIQIDEDGGMVGTPTLIQSGVKVTTLLNPALRAGGFVRLKSQKIAQYNAVYRVIDCKHRGGNQSAEWVTEMNLQKA